MPTPSKNRIHLYNTLLEMKTSVPYAVEDPDELSRVIARFVSWAQMIATHPNIAAKLGESSRAHIQLATDLRTAMKVSREDRLYPNVVLPMSKYFSAKVLFIISQIIEPELTDRIEQENQRWAEELPA